MRKTLFLLLTLSFALSACSPNKNQKQTNDQNSTSLNSVDVESGSSSGSNSDSESHGRVIYGEDDRKQPFEITDTEINLASHSSVALFEKRYLAKPKNLKNATYYNVNSTTFIGQLIKNRTKLCSGEKFSFSKEPATAYCSGSLISKNLILTAGHCVRSFESDENFCQNTLFAFDYETKIKSITGTGKNKKINYLYPRKIDQSKVYRCKQVKAVHLEETSYLDYAIIELDRDVMDRPPVQVATDYTVNYEDTVYVAGYPLGMPLKITTNGKVRDIYQDHFLATTDTYSGNSGSPVFNSQNVQVGILTGGEQDFTYDPVKKCYRAKICNDYECSGEDIVHTQSIFNDLQEPLF